MREFQKSLRNTAHAHKNQCSAIIERSACDDGFERKKDRKPIEKTSENRSRNERQTVCETIEKSPKIIGKTSPHRCKNGSASELCNKAVPRRPEGIRGLSLSVPTASRERPEASREWPGSVPRASRGVPRVPRSVTGASRSHPESSQIALKAPWLDLFIDFGSILARSRGSRDPSLPHAPFRTLSETSAQFVLGWTGWLFQTVALF